MLCYLGVPHHRSHKLNFNIPVTQASLSFHDKLIQILLLSPNYSSPDTPTETHSPQSCAIQVFKTLHNLALTYIFSLCSNHALPRWSSLLDNPPPPIECIISSLWLCPSTSGLFLRLLHAQLLLRLRFHSSITFSEMIFQPPKTKVSPTPPASSTL